MCVSVCLWARATSQIWEQKRALCSFERRHPKFLHRPKRLRCDSDPAGAATPQIAPPTRAPAGRRLTDARHSRHARSRSHHGHRSATVTPESLQAAGKLPCATTLSSLDAAVVTRRRRRVTSFAFPSGGAPAGASLHLRLPLRRRRPGAEYADCIYCADCGPKSRSVPRRATGLPTPVATTAAPARSSARPRADGMSMWTGGRASSVGQFVTSTNNEVVFVLCTSQDNYSVKRKICSPPIRETTNGGGEAGGSTLTFIHDM